jgi:hypothetical protein
MFISKREYLKHKYNIHLRALSDYQFVLESFLRQRSNFVYIKKVIVNYRLDGISANMTIWKSLKEGFIARRNAGMSLTGSLFFVFNAFTVFVFFGK